MSNVFVQQPAIQKLLRDSAGLDVAGGDERFKAIIHRLLENICTLIDDYNVTEEEFWHAVNYLHELGGRQEAALLAAGLGLEHFLDLRQDAIDAAAHRETGTPRTIEGPLYVANAPLAEGHARMDDGADAGAHQHDRRLAESEFPRPDQEGENEADQEVVEEFERVADDGSRVFGVAPGQEAQGTLDALGRFVEAFPLGVLADARKQRPDGFLHGILGGHRLS